MITHIRSNGTNNIEKVKITINWPVGTSRVKIYRFWESANNIGCLGTTGSRQQGQPTPLISWQPPDYHYASPDTMTCLLRGRNLKPFPNAKGQASETGDKFFPTVCLVRPLAVALFPATDAANHSCKKGRQSSIMGPMKFILDIGGEGAHPHAWNLNPSRVRTLNPHRGTPIPRLIPGRADAIPLPDHSVDQIIVERTPLRKAALAEIVRVLQRPGSVVLRHAMATDLDPHRLARTILPGLVRQRSIWVGRQMVMESYFCTDPVPNR